MNERREHVREIKLPTESEFRFELEAGAPIAIRVKSFQGPFQGYTSALPATTWLGRYTHLGNDLEETWNTMSSHRSAERWSIRPRCWRQPLA